MTNEALNTPYMLLFFKYIHAHMREPHLDLKYVFLAFLTSGLHTLDWYDGIYIELLTKFACFITRNSNIHLVGGVGHKTNKSF